MGEKKRLIKKYWNLNSIWKKYNGESKIAFKLLYYRLGKGNIKIFEK